MQSRERERGGGGGGGGLSQVNMVGGWPAEHHWRLESPELRPLCARLHCHDGAVDHGHPFGNAVYTMPMKTLGKQ